MASHRLIGWIFWDPVGIERYAALGVPNGAGYYIVTRAAPLASAGHRVVTAAFGSIHAGFVELCLGLALQHTTFEAAYDARNEAVAIGLRAYVPELLDELGSMAPALWAAADSLPLSGRVLYAAHVGWPRREEDPALSAWLALNCIREWRADTHWAVLAAEDISGVQAGLLHDAFLGYPGDWIPRSRGADDAALALALEGLAARGLVTDGRVNEAGLALRQQIEDRTDDLSTKAGRHLGADATQRFVDLVMPVGGRLMDRIDQTAGPNWMPAARDSRRG